MAQVAQPTEEARRKLKQAVASAATRRTRARLFQAYVLVASATFVTLAVLAHTTAYFQLDLTITRFVQSYHGEWFAGLMYALSWVGFAPQCYYIGTVIVTAMFVAGLRWEAVCLAFTMIDTLIGIAIKEIVFRPRPSPDLVHVLRELNSPAFPSGHVLMIVGFGGFLAFLVFTLLKPSLARTIT